MSYQVPPTTNIKYLQIKERLCAINLIRRGVNSSALNFGRGTPLCQVCLNYSTT